MPSGPPQDHEYWSNHGPHPGDFNAIKFLESRGYVMKRNYSWVMPTGQERPTDQESYAIRYLIQEWDFGGIEN